MTTSWRSSTLADRHRVLGSGLEDWNGMATAWSYSTDVRDHHVAVRTKAGLMDVSGLKKIHLVGPHATAILDYTTSRNLQKVTPGRSVYATALNDSGKFIDDCVLYRTGPNSWMVVHGAGSLHEMLSQAVVGRNAAMLFDDDLHDLSLQGPVAVDFLERHVPGIRQLNYFHHMQTTLFGAPVMISRTGYTGERGYEIFCKGVDAPLIWDSILEDGKGDGIVPVCFTALDLLRVESCLLFYPYDNSEMYPFEQELAGDTLWELGLNFTVSPGKTYFRGAPAHFALKGKERFKIFGLLLDGDVAAGEGSVVYDGERKVGVVTCAMVSKLTGKSMALARMDVPYAIPGKHIVVISGDAELAGVTHILPFDDPEKKKRTAKG
ncbi:aminomethyltransferase family protein [Acetobacter sp.]|jgi:aminomethyltransferase|uniref:aminomethyltransferase family protein n=1 Tax=Acetobacter sp. TaxID=440 RepID=UPI0025C0DD33|nr:aminomethyltransferase family protein [Acetobacter sp.]MCH4092045.1 aminomethyltransferase family protein [Acetobacter sp.]MCI1300700.1 aminomethyltransferase family protein [Acetobacter sp.]MCI1317635.1 aminomethyltransferase family protein [Acetobacter sp.]